MAQQDNDDSFHGLPIITSATASPNGRQSLTDQDDHPKQPQQPDPSCTTQASPPAMTDDQARTLSAYSTSPTDPSPDQAETAAPPSGESEPSRSPRQGGADGSPPEGGPDSDLTPGGGQREDRQYSPGEIQQRIEGMWLGQPGDAERYDEYEACQQAAHPDQNVHPAPPPSPSTLPRNLGDFESGLPQLHGWPTPSLNSNPWKLVHGGPQRFRQQTFEIPSNFGIGTTAGEGHLPTAAPSYDPPQMGIKPDYDMNEADLFDVPISNSSAFQEYGPLVKVSTPASRSPCTTSLYPYEGPQDINQCGDLPEEAFDAMEYKEEVWYDDSRGHSPRSVELTGGKVDEPYAQLIYKAFLSRPNKSMTLQEIYQWFRENTDKAKSEGRGWMNSIRHNLSMNGAFTKRNSKAATRNSDGSLSFDAASGADGRKSTEWFLEPAFYTGVESTTRYRRGNSGSRSRGAACGGGGGGGGAGGTGAHAARTGARNDHHGGSGAGGGVGGGGGYSHARVSAGRKGGNVAAQNRRRHAERQQQQARAIAVMARNDPRYPHHHHQHLQMLGGAFHPPPHDGLPMQYPDFTAAAHHLGGGGLFHSEYTPAQQQQQQQQQQQRNQHPVASSPFSLGDALTAQVQQPQDGPRHLDNVNYFGPQDVGSNLHGKQPGTLGGTEADDNHRAEPTTPPDSSTMLDQHPPPPPGGDHHYPLTGGKQHGDYLPEMMMGRSLNPLNYQAGGGGHYDPAAAAATSNYTLADVTGVYEPAIGTQPPPLFWDDENVSQADLMSFLEQ